MQTVPGVRVTSAHHRDDQIVIAYLDNMTGKVGAWPEAWVPVPERPSEQVPTISGFANTQPLFAAGFFAWPQLSEVTNSFLPCKRSAESQLCFDLVLRGTVFASKKQKPLHRCSGQTERAIHHPIVIARYQGAFCNCQPRDSSMHVRYTL